MLKRMIAFIISLMMLFSFDASYAEGEGELSGIRAAMLMERSGAVLTNHSGDEKLEVGGLARLPVLLAVCKKIDSGGLNMKDNTTVSAAAARVPGPTAFIEPNESIEVSVLLKAAVMICAGDAIYALGEAAFGSSEACCAEVNSIVSGLGIEAGYSDISGAGIRLSASDLCRIGAELIESKAFTLYSCLYYDKILHEDGRETELASSNKLIKSCPGTNGVGTGSSAEAGYCGVFSVKRGNTCYICAIIGAEGNTKRAEKAKSLIEQGFALYDVKQLAQKGQVFETVPVKGGTLSSVELAAKDDVSALIPKNTSLDELREIPEELTAPVDKGDIAGRISYRLNGEEAAFIELLPGMNIARAGIWDYVRMAAASWAS